jgi:hypothetical protein
MGLFEHVAVAFSMVLSFGVARLLDGLRPSLAPGRRYWVHAAWLVQKLVGAALYWWGFLSLRDGVVWSSASFLWVLLTPGFLFLQATALVGSDPSGVASWRKHFFEIRRWFFGVDIALILHSIITSTVLRELPLVHPFRALQATGLAMSICGAATASPRVHAVLAPLALTLQTLGLGSLFFRPRS